jgi:Transposase DDE domain
MSRPAPTPLREADLQRWKLVATFRQALAEAIARHGLSPSFADPKRLLDLADYLSLFLFGLLNPVVRTMRGLCQASHLERVQRELCSRPVSLGSFSEAQHVLDPVLLAEVFRALAEQVPPDERLDPRLRTRPWLIVDSTLWEALPRMRWALWRHQHQTQRAVRLHLGFHLLESRPARAMVTAGNGCERAAWRAQWEPGDCYVSDRYYGEDYAAFTELEQRHCAYVIRLRQNAVVRVEQELPLSEADREAQVPRQAWVRLGARGPGVRVRLVWVQTPKELLWLATNLSVAAMSAELVAQLYRCRRQVELFFRWIKCILENRHWLAESECGVSTQVYLALIAALLLQLFTGRRPTRRMLELIQWYLLGWASVEELTARLDRELARPASKKRL